MAKRQSKKNLAVAILGILALLCLSLILFLKSPVFEVTHKTQDVHLEIGTDLSTSPTDYLEGEDWCVTLSYVDTSAVKESKVGRYPIYIYHGFEKYTSYVTVLDTTAPVVTCDVKNKTITSGDVVSVHTLGLNIKDHSEIDSIAFTRISSTHFYTGLPDEVTEDMRNAYEKGLDMYAEEFQFSYGGVYTLTISVTDTFHNSSEITLNLTVEQPPVLEVPSDFYVAVNHEVNFEEYITAWDFIQEDFEVTDVEIDSSQLNLSKTGDYEVVFTATDDYGLTSGVVSVVHVNTQDVLQKQINTHEIDVTKHVIIGAYNPYDIGYYENVSLAEIKTLMLPSIVHIQNDKLDTFGSGYIIEITDEFITIATNEHVINSDLIVDVTFSNAQSFSASVVASNAREDIAFIRIPISEKGNEAAYPQEHLSQLRTVHIDKDYWDNLENEAKVAFCYNCIDLNAESWITNEGYLLEKVAIRDWNEYTDIKETIISTEPIAGSSGSALFNEQGKLVGMIRGYTDYESYTETVAVPLERILVYFEYVFKYRIEYQ